LIDVDLKEVEKTAEAAGAPITPGRLPEWKDRRKGPLTVAVRCPVRAVAPAASPLPVVPGPPAPGLAGLAPRPGGPVPRLAGFVSPPPEVAAAVRPVAEAVFLCT